MKKTKLIALVLAISAAAPVVANDAAYVKLCRKAHIKMNADDYHRIKGLLPKHAISISPAGEANVSFGNVDYPQTASLSQQLQRYGGLKCVNAAEWYAAHQHVLTHKVGKGFIDCVISDFDEAIPDKDYQRVICLPMRYQ